MKKLLMAICLSMAVVMAVSPAFAINGDDFHARGVAVGYASGATAPPGLYFIDDSFFAPSWTAHGVADNPALPGTNAREHNPNVKVFAYLNLPIMVWVPGCKFLGADYSMSFTEPFLYQNIRVKTGGTVQTSSAPQTNSPTWLSGETWASYNTVWSPLELSWKLPCNFFVKTGFAIGFDDAWNSDRNSIASVNGISGGLRNSISKYDGNVYAWIGQADWMFVPTLGISWLYQGWNISAGMGYVFYTKDTATNYQNADQFFGDYTISYTCGKWTLGLIGESSAQVGRDSFDAGDGTGYHKQNGTQAENYGMGPLIGYNFGPCSVQFWYEFELETRNQSGGDWFGFRIIVPLGNPCPLFGSK